MVDSAREVCGSVRTARKNQRSKRCNNVITAAVERKEAPWKDVLGEKDEIVERCMEIYS